MSYIPKTNRRYGLIYRKIRNLARLRPTFTALDLPYSRLMAGVYLRNLVSTGELRIVQPATIGRYARPAVYMVVHNSH